MLYRITDGNYEGMTGVVQRWWADEVRLTLTCQPGQHVIVPRAAIEAVDPRPVSAADARRLAKAAS